LILDSITNRGKYVIHTTSDNSILTIRSMLIATIILQGNKL